MNKIGFQNFRRFKDFTPLEYKGITFLVGKNNSGKSTLVKALLLVNEFLRSNKVNTFSFGNSVLEDANIVTYERAKNKFAKEDKITFNYQIDNYIIDIEITGENEKTTAKVNNFNIFDVENRFEIDIKSEIITLSSHNKLVNEYKNAHDSTIEKLKKQANDISIEIKRFVKNKASFDYISMQEELLDIKKKIKILSSTLKNYKYLKKSFTVDAHYKADKSFSDIFDDFIIEIYSRHDVKFRERASGKKTTKEFENLSGFKEEAFNIERSFKEFYKCISSNSLIYLGANSAKQSALFAIRDKNNALAQAIHEYKQLGIDKETGSPAYLFTKKWMSKENFEIGDDIEINMHAGEAYEVKINTNNMCIPLADKGMGSVQAMLLIIRLACIIYKTGKNYIPTTVIIEEPELNLHPALQSKLADLFLECKVKFGLNFIIETHSEYILRRSQVIVAEKEFEIAPNENPFCVFYFPTETNQNPYQLEYQEDGVFDKNFGEGFFDVASLSTMRLIRLRREKKA
jgi:predicted ATPase